MSREGMTLEEAIKMANADLLCMERDSSGLDEMCNNHKCDECHLNYERGNMGEQKEWLRLAIKALEREYCVEAMSKHVGIDEILKWVTRQESIGRYAVLICELKQLCEDILSELPPVTQK